MTIYECMLLLLSKLSVAACKWPQRVRGRCMVVILLSV